MKAVSRRGPASSPFQVPVLFAMVRTLALAVATAMPVLAQNAIVTENQNAGTPSSTWYIPHPGDANIQGFATDMSVQHGDTVHFKVDTDSPAYHIDIYRLGWYQGLGARSVGTGVVTATLPQTQPAPLYDTVTGMSDCGNWAESAHWDVPASAVSGVYLANLIRDDATAGSSSIVFVVRDDTSTSDLLMQTSDATWQAYNVYPSSNGGKSLYPAVNGGPPGFNHATKVSYNRPFDIRHSDGSPGDDVFAAEYAMLRWLERNGYDVTYTSSVDTARNGNLIQQHGVFLSVGHDEYWSGEARTNVTAARDAGVHLAFFSGNEVYWKTRFEPSSDGSNTPYRTLVCYKEGTLGENVCGGKCDPSAEWTGLWRDGCAPTYAPNDACLPENALTGQISWDGSIGQIEVPDTFKDLRFWRNTSIATLTTGQTAVLGQQSLGSEWDHEQPLYAASYPPRRIKLSTTVLSGKTHHLSLYRADSGALVFGAGTIQWSWGLDDFHTFAQVPTHTDMQQATVNLFADMGAVPDSLQPGLVPAAASSDTQAPASVISAPADGSSTPQSNTVILQGMAADSGGGVVAGVEVSVDGGSTWVAASGTTNWSYAWAPAAQGTVIVKSRAFDDTGNLEVAGGIGDLNVITITVTAPMCPCTVFPSALMPTELVGNDTSAIEVGMKFRTDVAGHITALRYFKPAGATGTHTGSLWTSTGVNLAQEVFTNETPSGWQEVALTTPIAVTAGTTYVVSYFSASGDYVGTNNYFAQQAGNGFVHGLADGLDGPNGLYQYTLAPAFPTQTFQKSNYWADVVFEDSLVDTTPPTVTSHVPTTGATAVPTDSLLTAMFSEALDAGTVNGTTFELRDALNAPVAANVFYDSVLHKATLVPAGWLDPLATYTAIVHGGGTDPRIKDLAGNALAADATWSFSTAASASTIYSVFPRNEVPAGGLFNDTQPTVGMELGMKFRADVDGFITALRYYKPTGASGTHTGNLWTGTGTNLAQQVFTGETASGWQEVALTTPVAITANTTYVVTYFSSSGDYTSTQNYFTQSTSGALVHGLANGLDGPNGLYLYTATSAFPTQAFNSSNYWADVVFATSTGPDVTPPTVTDHVPAANATAVPIGTTVTVTFSEQLDPLTVDGTTIELQDALSMPVPASVTYNGGNLTATLTPAAALDPLAIYTVIVHGGGTDPRIKDTTGNALAADTTWTFTTAGRPPLSYTVFPASTVPTSTLQNDNEPTVGMEIGMRFRADVDGTVTALRYYKPAGATGVHVGNLWTNGGTLLATQAFTGETASGWQEVTLTTPVPVAAGTTYLVSYFTSSGDYTGVNHVFDQQVGTTLVHGLADGFDGANGIYLYTAASAFPTQTFLSSSYYADLRFVPDVPDATAPTVTGQLPAPDAAGVPTNTTISVTFSEVLDASTVDGSTIELRDAFNALVAASVGYTTGSLTATLAPSAWLDPLASYTVIVRGGTTGPRVKDPSGNALAADASWSFTTSAVPMGPFTVFLPNEAPTNPVFNDNQPTVSMELGMKFRADVAGFVTALRYFKPAGTTGTHTGHLWTGTGTQLAEQVFTGETASGWQEVTLTTPLPIAANTTYVVTYFTASGDYAATGNYFTQPIGTGVLHGLANGTDGPNGIYEYTATSTFPTQSFNSANYYADVVFDTASHTLTVQQTGNGTVARNPDQASYYPGSSTELTATPDAGWSFAGWSGDASGTANPLTVLMDADKTITATFTLDPILRVLTVNTSGNGSVGKNPDLPNYVDGSSVVLTANPAPHHTFAGWSGDASGMANPLAVLMDANKVITATFTLDTHTVAVNTVGSGSVARNPDLAQYDYGTSVTLTATADVGYTFTGWSGDASGTTNPLSVLVDADKSITATFTLDTHTVAVNTVGSGSVARSPDLAQYDYGTSVTLTATADVGYTFTGWSGDASGTTNPLSVLVDGDKSITATFTLESYPLAVTIGGGAGGAVTANPDLPTYPYGTSVDLTATADVGYTFLSWSGDASGSANPLTVLMDGSKNITANFLIDSHTLAASVVGSGSVTKSPDLPSYMYGSSVLLTALPDPGQIFAGWSGDASGAANPLSVLMDADKAITATFTLDVQPAANTPFGSGCYTLSNSFYQHFPTPAAAAAALTGQSITLTPAGSTYDVSYGGGTYLAPSGTANTILVGIDDGRETIVPSAPVPYPGGSTASLSVHSNGIIGTAPLTIPDSPNSHTPTIAEFLAEGTTAWYHWHDFDTADGGAIRWEEVAGVLYVTWQGVESYPLGTANPSTFQFQFDLNPGPGNGVVRYVWDSIAAVGGAPASGRADQTLVGWSPGGASLDAGSVDLALATPFSTWATEVPPLTLAIAPTPVSTPTTGTVLTYTVSNIPEAAPGSGLYIGVVFLSFAPIPGGLDLDALLGAPDCRTYIETTDITINVGPVTSPIETGTFAFPAAIPYGLEVTAQAASLVIPGSLPNGQNPGGFLTSNAVTQFVSDF